MSTEISLRNAQLQGVEREFKEHSQNTWIIQQTAEAERKQASQKTSNANRGIHSEFIEHSQKSPGALNVGNSRVQAADQMTTQHIPLTGYENFLQELQTYPVLRDPMTVQPTGVGNVSSSAIFDLPNVNTNLPPPLLLNPSSHYQQQHHNQEHPTEVTQDKLQTVKS